MSELDDDLDRLEADNLGRGLVTEYRKQRRFQELLHVTDSDGRTNSHMARKIAEFEARHGFFNHPKYNSEED